MGYCHSWLHKTSSKLMNKFICWLINCNIFAWMIDELIFCFCFFVSFSLFVVLRCSLYIYFGLQVKFLTYHTCTWHTSTVHKIVCYMFIEKIIYSHILTTCTKFSWHVNVYLYTVPLYMYIGLLKDTF